MTSGTRVRFSFSFSAPVIPRHGGGGEDRLIHSFCLYFSADRHSALTVVSYGLGKGKRGTRKERFRPSADFGLLFRLNNINHTYATLGINSLGKYKIINGIHTDTTSA